MVASRDQGRVVVVVVRVVVVASRDQGTIVFVKINNKESHNYSHTQCVINKQY